MKSLVLAYVLFGVFVVIERRLRSDETARSFREQPTDKGTTRLVGAAYGLALTAGLAAPSLSARGIGRLPCRELPRMGLGLMLAGLSGRIWAARTLGRFYTRTLKVVENQSVVRHGPYRMVRHPGYAADLLLWLGFGLASGNAIVTASICLAMAAVYARRIQAEESMLVDQLGNAYSEYQRSTWRLLPLVY